MFWMFWSDLWPRSAVHFKVWSYCEKREPRARSPSVWYKNPFEFVAQLCLPLGMTAYFAKPTWAQKLIETCNCSRLGLALSVFSVFLDTNLQESGRSGFLAYLGNRSWWEFYVEPVKDELPGLNFGLAFANKHLVFSDTNCCPFSQETSWFPCYLPAVEMRRERFTEDVPSKGKTSLLNGITRGGSC